MLGLLISVVGGGRGELSLLDFSGFGLRLQSVGVDGQPRGGSSKLSAFDSTSSIPTPESTTMFLLGLGLIGIAGITRKNLQK